MIKKYGFFGFIRLLRDRTFTKLFFKNSRIIRSPYYIRGRSNIDFGKQLTTGVNVRIDAFPIYTDLNEKIIVFGNNVQLNDYVHIAAITGVTIGDNVLIASKVFITDHNHGMYSGDSQSNPSEMPSTRILSGSRVNIGHNVWIGEYVCVLPGVTIGEGSIIGAMSVVTKDIPPNSIAVGSPAKVVKVYNFENGIWERVNENN